MATVYKNNNTNNKINTYIRQLVIDGETILIENYLNWLCNIQKTEHIVPGIMQLLNAHTHMNLIQNNKQTMLVVTNGTLFPKSEANYIKMWAIYSVQHSMHKKYVQTTGFAIISGIYNITYKMHIKKL